MENVAKKIGKILHTVIKSRGKKMSLVLSACRREASEEVSGLFKTVHFFMIFSPKYKAPF